MFKGVKHFRWFYKTENEIFLATRYFLFNYVRKIKIKIQKNDIRGICTVFYWM